MVILFAAFSLSFMPFTYLWSHAFTKAKAAARFFPFFCLLIFFILPQVPIWVKPEVKIFSFILPIFSPLIGLVNGMLS